MKRPLSLTILASAYLLLALLSVGSTLLSTIEGVRQFPSVSPDQGALLISFLTTFCYIALGVSLLQLRPLARSAALFLAGLAFLMALLLVVFLVVTPAKGTIQVGSYHTTFAQSPLLGITLLLLLIAWASWNYYILTRERIRELFGPNAS